MTEFKFLRLGSDTPDCIHCELARLIGFYVQGRVAFGEVTTVQGLRTALAKLVEEIDQQMEDAGEEKMH